MIRVHMRHECWTSQRSLSCSPWKSVCHIWTATDATHNSMPDRESILAGTAGWLISVCIFCLCSARGWKPYVWWFLEMKEFLNLRQSCWVERAGPIPWPGSSCDNAFWDNFTDHIYIPPWWKDTMKLNMFWDLLSLGIVHSTKW